MIRGKLTRFACLAAALALLASPALAGQFDSEGVELAAYRTARRGVLRSTIPGLQRFARGVAGPVPNLIDVLPEIEVPALVLAGEKDAAFARASHVMAAKLPRAERVELSGAGHVLNLDKTGPMLEEAYLAAWNGLIEDDSFNRLILLSGLTAREVTVLRAYARYLRQTGITYSQGYIADTLNKYPAIASDIFKLFVTRMDPTLEEKPRAKRTAILQAGIEQALNNVPSLDEDQILRRYVNAGRMTIGSMSVWAIAAAITLPAGWAGLLVAALFAYALLRAMITRSARPHRMILTGASVVLATLAILVLIGMQVYRSGRLRRRRPIDVTAEPAATPGG